MSADKRSTHTDALATLGTIITDGGRDAIHLAVEPVIAGEQLPPGVDIGLKDGLAYSSGKKIKYVGIVDPFLKRDVKKGEKFWLIVYPRQITSLRHVWEHPDFESEKDERLPTNKNRSQIWLENWCNTSEISYDDLVALFTDGNVSQDEDYGDRWRNEGEYLISRGRDAHGSIPDEVWDHLEMVIGQKITQRPTHFSCSC